jgi:hypothetical protein
MHRRLRTVPHFLSFGSAMLIGLLGLLGSVAAGAQPATPAATAIGCTLPGMGGAMSHVIVLQFDNVHFARDTANVPSDLEQMPHLLNFLESNGVVLTNNHTPLISHTANDLLTSLTGVYPDRHGQPVANSYRYFNPDGSTGLGVSFAYWSAPVFDPTSPAPTDTSYTMLSAPRTNAPAPWMPYTRAGCDVGAVATANTVLENTGIDIPTVFGADSPEAAEAAADSAQAAADFVGIAVHCAQASALCSADNGGRPDLLPSEPGGYDGFNALFGSKWVAPQISPSGPLTDLAGQPIADPDGNPGFPGFDGMSAAVSLSYVAAMQEHGIPVTYAYISDAHDAHPSGPAYGPGEAGYVAALKAYDDAFATFFDRLSKDGITPANTLFAVYADEGDHFVGSAPQPANCDGVATPCTYESVGEATVNLTGLLAAAGVTTPFTLHADSAPAIYVTGNPAGNDPAVRTLEQTAAAITVTNPYTGKTEPLTTYLADRVEMKLLHMVTADAARTPIFTIFAKPDYFLAGGDPTCGDGCVVIDPKFAWNHGDVDPDITTTWVGFAGPGVKRVGVDATTWADQTDIRPTMLTLLGLRDDYLTDGRVLIEDLDDAALPPAVAADRETYIQLATLYKQLTAPLGEFGMTSLDVATKAVAGHSPDDAAFVAWEDALAALGGQRDTLASRMVTVLTGAAFDGQAIDETAAGELTNDAQAMLVQLHALQAAPPAPPAAAVTPAAVPSAATAVSGATPAP